MNDKNILIKQIKRENGKEITKFISWEQLKNTTDKKTMRYFKSLGGKEYIRYKQVEYERLPAYLRSTSPDGIITTYRFYYYRDNKEI